MGFIQEAVDAGIEKGFQQALVDSCDGRYERDRCPMPTGKCACAFADYRSLPFWRRLFTEKPDEPSGEECLRAVIWQEIGK